MSDPGDGTMVSTLCILPYISLFRWDRIKSSSLSFILCLRLSSSRRTPWYMVCKANISQILQIKMRRYARRVLAAEENERPIQ